MDYKLNWIELFYDDELDFCFQAFLIIFLLDVSIFCHQICRCREKSVCLYTSRAQAVHSGDITVRCDRDLMLA